MFTSALSHLECSKCAAQLDADVQQHLCPCGGPLLARYDTAKAAQTLTHQSLEDRSGDLLRWTELLPLRNPTEAVSLGERETPLFALEKTGAAFGIAHLIVKDESHLPTGSFKARGAAIGVSKARELGVRELALPTNGNAGAAWAAYAARAEMRAHIVMSRDAPPIHRRECSMAGAEVHLVDGSIADAGKVSAGLVSSRGCYDASGFREPHRIEGKKTMGFEIARALDWRLPDVIVYPTGGGLGFIGIHKGFEELRALGLIGSQLPRFVAVQSSGCAPMVRAWQQNAETATEWTQPHTIAYGINVPKSLGDPLVLKILRATEGTATSVDDSAIKSMIEQVGREEGILLCPEGAATLVAAKQLRASGWIRADDRVLVMNTGSGLKYL
jgi:threonine synthase